MWTLKRGDGLRNPRPDLTDMRWTETMLILLFGSTETGKADGAFKKERIIFNLHEKVKEGTSLCDTTTN